jgi:hypothetical protein
MIVALSSVSLSDATVRAPEVPVFYGQVHHGVSTIARQCAFVRIDAEGGSSIDNEATHG